MARIGFGLQRAAEEEHIGDLFRGFFFPAAAAATPWLISAAVMGIVALLREAVTPLVLTTLAATYYFSLALTGIFQLAATRAILDRLDRGGARSVMPTCIGALAATLAAGIPFALILSRTVEAPSLYRVTSIILFQAVTASLVTSALLALIRASRPLVLAWLGGTAVGVTAAFLLEARFHEIGVLTGFLAGHCITLIALLVVLVSECDQRGGVSYPFLDYLRGLPALGVVAPVCYLGFWAHLIVMRLYRPFDYFTAGHYEITWFIAQLSAIPAVLVYFFIVEPRFFDACRAYSRAIMHRSPLKTLEERRDTIARTLGNGLSYLLRIQLPVTLSAVLAAPFLIGSLAGDPHAVRLLRVDGSGALLQALTFLTIIIMLSFAQYWQGVAVAGLYLVLNTTLAALFIRIGPAWDGWSTVIAGAVCLVAGSALLARSLQRLELLTFMGKATPGLRRLTRDLVHPGGLGRFHPIPQRAAAAAQAATSEKTGGIC